MTETKKCGACQANNFSGINRCWSCCSIFNVDGTMQEFIQQNSAQNFVFEPRKVELTDLPLADESAKSAMVLHWLIKVFYDHPENICGGPLHIVLDDYNIENSNIDWCLENGDVCDLGKEICNRLKFFDDETRYAIVSGGEGAIYDDYE